MQPALPELAPTHGVRAMLYQMAELLLRYPDDEAQRLAAAEATANPFLAEAPDLATVAEWLQFFGENMSADELRRSYEQGQLVSFALHPPCTHETPRPPPSPELAAAPALTPRPDAS